MTKKIVTLLNIFLFFFLLLSACKKNDIDIISPDKIDKVKVIVTDNTGKIKKFTVTDTKEIERLSIKIKMILGKSKNTSWFADKKITEKERMFKYQINFYKSNTLIQEIKISKNNELSVNEEKIIIDKEKEKELDNLKKHLLVITA